jgi:ketosteroid isomerase-like protein
MTTACVVAGLVLSCSQGGGQGTEAARAAITAANAEFVASAARGDSTAMGRLYSADAQALPPNGEPVQGPDAIGALWQRVIDSGVKEAALETAEVEVRGDLAFETGRYTLKAADGTDIDNGKYVVIWKREGTDWRLFRDIWNSSRPIGPEC